jgi:predicted transcriptional regulator
MEMNLVDILVSALTGKKTIVKFSAGDYDIRIALLGKVKGPADFDQERLESALKEGMRNVLAQFVAKEMAKKADALAHHPFPILKP